MKIGVFIPRLPNNVKKMTTLDHMSSYENVFVCVPNGMQRLERYPAGVVTLPIGGDVITARNNIMQYAQKYGYDAIWVIEDDLERFVTVVNGNFAKTKFTPYHMGCRVGGIATPLFMRDAYAMYAASGKTKTGMAHGMIYFEDLSLRYRDREKYGHEDCDLYLRLVKAGYDTVIDTTHFKEHANNSKVSLTNSNNPKYNWLLYREWGDFIEFNKYMSAMKVDRKFLHSARTHTKYPNNIHEFFKLQLSKNKRYYNIDKLIEKVPEDLRTIH